MSSEPNHRSLAGKSTERIPPLTPAHHTMPVNRPRCWFNPPDDSGIVYTVKREAELRAPNEESYLRHLTGVAGEFGVSGYVQAPINRDIYGNFTGDEGYDIELYRYGKRWKVEVKTVRNGDLELVVDYNRVNEADYFVLCRTSDPTTMVELVGWITRPDLKTFGERYPGDESIRVDARYLSPFEPLEITPDKIRAAQDTDL